MSSNSNIGSLLQAQKTTLSTCNPDRLEREFLVAKVLRTSRLFCYSHPEYELNTAELAEFNELLQQRLHGKPLAYIIGKQEFWSLDFIVTSDVLIPRPETELLVEQVLDQIQNHTDRFTTRTILDLGTGSGCIAIALAKELPNWHITAVDSCTKALDVAKQNAQRNHVRNISFITSNWFDAVNDKQFSVIVSNPPYIAEHDPALEHNVKRYEPSSALIAADNGLANYKHIIEQAQYYTQDRHILAFEIGYQQAQSVTNLLHRYAHVDVIPDLQLHDRVILAHA